MLFWTLATDQLPTALDEATGFREVMASPSSRFAAERSAGVARLTTPYSITSSARPLNGSGTVMPSALAVLRLMYSSTFVPGRSAGFSPLRIRPV